MVVALTPDPSVPVKVQSPEVAGGRLKPHTVSPFPFVDPVQAVPWAQVTDRREFAVNPEAWKVIVLPTPAVPGTTTRVAPLTEGTRGPGNVEEGEVEGAVEAEVEPKVEEEAEDPAPPTTTTLPEPVAWEEPEGSSVNVGEGGVEERVGVEEDEEKPTLEEAEVAKGSAPAPTVVKELSPEPTRAPGIGGAPPWDEETGVRGATANARPELTKSPTMRKARGRVAHGIVRTRRMRKGVMAARESSGSVDARGPGSRSEAMQAALHRVFLTHRSLRTYFPHPEPGLRLNFGPSD